MPGSRSHPTHHDRYNTKQLLWAVLVGLGGVFFCVIVIGLDTEESELLHALKTVGLAAGALAFVGGVAYAVAREFMHTWTRCPECRRLLHRSEIDYDGSYYPCRRCDITWTCECKLASGD